MFPAVAAPARFEMGRVLQRLFAVLGRHFWPFFLCSLLVTGIPLGVIGWLQVSVIGTNPETAGYVGLVGLLALPVTLIANALLQAAIIHGTVEDLNGRRVSIGASLSKSVSLILPLIGVSIVVGLLTSLAAIALLVPGIMVAMTYAVAVPAQVVERRGVFESMSRSADLTRNHRWAIFGLGVICFVLVIVLTMLAGGLGAFAAAAAPIGFLQLNVLLITPLTQVVANLFAAAGIASIYYELRFIKDGMGLEALASVFD